MQFNMRFIEGKSESPTYEARTFTKLRGKRRTKERILRSGQIKYFVLSKYSDTRFGRKFLEKNNYRRIKRIKGHIIYERTKCPYCQKRRGRNRPS